MDFNDDRARNSMLTILITIKLIFQYSILIAFLGQGTTNLSLKCIHSINCQFCRIMDGKPRNLCKVLPTIRDEYELSTFKSTLDVGFDKMNQVRQYNADLDSTLSRNDIVV